MSSAGIQEEDHWYHGSITRELAEERLREHGDEGRFLVRESTSSVGDYALSVLSKNNVVHIQIYRHDHDAFFSIDNETVIHGLDELIKYYQTKRDDEKNSVIPSILLKKPVLHSPPPSDCRRHGRTNLLHRATKEGNTEIVRAMVQCGHRSLDAKNDEGQTAAHIASINGFNEILLVLIEAKTNVNAKDGSGHTPLYYATKFNHPSTVRILMKEGKANPQLRRPENEWVALHEAAHQGLIDVVRVLLEFHAPLRPRTADNKLPVDLAIENGHTETAALLSTHRDPFKPRNRNEWYHSCLERQEAYMLLQQCQNVYTNESHHVSYFLVRRSANNKKLYVLSLLYQGAFSNYEILREGKYFYIDNGPYLDSLEQVVEHYSRWADGLPAKLQQSISPTQSFEPPQRTPSDSLLIPPPLPKRTPHSSPNGYRLQSNPVSPNNNNSDSLVEKENVPAEWLEMGEQLGSGEYGEVYSGTLQIPNKSKMDVAIKTLKEEMNEWAKSELLREARVMMDLEHEFIVKLIGISWEPKICMIQELMSLGSMQDYLLDHKDLILPDPHIRRWSFQIASGMVYLQKKRFVHRDLAARNILLQTVDLAKISDFGLSRALSVDKNYYAASQGGRWPIKWYSPESCTLGTFSHKSDVWSFGITLWEMYSYGETPYGELQGKEVIEMVEKGFRLDKPFECSEQIFEIISQCWLENPDERPSFQELADFFAF